MSETQNHVWNYRAMGGIRQIILTNGADLANLANLDRRLWTALAAPIAGLRLDARTLQLLDADGDGRIRPDEILSAVKWLSQRGVDLDALFTPDPQDAERLAAVVAQQADLAKAPPSESDQAALTAWENEPAADPAILPLGEGTGAASDALAAVEAPVNAFFAVPDDLPLVTDAADAELPLTRNVNPKWLSAIRAFDAACVKPLLGERERLSRSDWSAIKAKLAPYRAWLAAKPVAAANAKARLEDEERALRYKMNLVPFLRNYLNQNDLYSPDALAAYQIGVLYVDGRACHLCFHVDNEGAHAALAEKSKCCLLYCRLTRKGAAPRTICAVITAGRVGTLFAGRNGLFLDRDGLDWDAVVTKVVESQVSLREAFWAPWIKMGQMIGEQVKKFIGARQNAASSGVAKATEKAAGSKPDAQASATALASSVAALGVGVGMMGAAIAGVVGVIAGLPAWKVACGVVAVVLAVSLPNVFLTWFKLRARDLGAVLNAGGWAVNRPLRFSQRLAKTFTRLAVLPPGSRRA